MEKDPNKEILDNIEKGHFWGASCEQEIESYVKEKNQQQRIDGVIDKDNIDTINVNEEPDAETKKKSSKSMPGELPSLLRLWSSPFLRA